MRKRELKHYVVLGVLLMGIIMLSGCTNEKNEGGSSKDYQQKESMFNSENTTEEKNVPEEFENEKSKDLAWFLNDQADSEDGEKTAKDVVKNENHDVMSEESGSQNDLQSDEQDHKIKEELDEGINKTEFPIFLDSGKLSVNSFFQTDGFNPDCGNEEGTEIASIVLKNESKDYLAKADVVLTLSDGNKVNYAVFDLPSGKSAMAFSVDNLSVEQDVTCVDVACEAVYKESSEDSIQRVFVEVDGIDISVTNISDKEISEVILYCHNVLDGEYFGGTSYVYTVENLEIGETVEIQAVNCILGMAEVVFTEVK